MTNTHEDEFDSKRELKRNERQQIKLEHIHIALKLGDMEVLTWFIELLQVLQETMGSEAVNVSSDLQTQQCPLLMLPITTASRGSLRNAINDTTLESDNTEWMN